MNDKGAGRFGESVTYIGWLRAGLSEVEASELRLKGASLADTWLKSLPGRGNHT